MSGSLPTRVAVIGAGTMGSGIAQVFAQAGCQVGLCDTSEAVLRRAREDIRTSLARFVARDTLGQAEADAALDRIRETSLDACADTDLVVEAIVEDVQAKRELFARLDGICPPGVPFASNTSSVSITRLAAATSRPERVFGLHFMNPVPVMPLVEIVRGQRICAL